MKRIYNLKIFSIEVIAIAIALVFLVPFYYVIVNSLKPFAEILLNTSALPKELMWENYSNAFEKMNFGKVFLNSLIITVSSNIVIVVFCSMAAYMLVRTKGKLSTVLFFMFVAAMVIPFQSIMIPLVKFTGKIHLINSIPGLVFMYLGFGAGLSIFLYHGFIKGIPIELEEAAIIDGCSRFGVFWRIVFPLLKPITVTIIILNSLWIWNDFLLPLLVLQDASLRTIPLATFYFFGQFTKQWDLALAALVISILPLLILFFFLQKHIIKGITAGSIK
ncbi:carbohydrate ABC transporter permease [Peribacillus tepidiphilus]|jgi:raffinose/stachyose/melibiose transport system permease protein|uniref:carbohydrate ABC transporter permease n=1 Tax=Peribacillus tepidiphilus TaxID=2652445 RepID=UPI0035B52353